MRNKYHHVKDLEFNLSILPALADGELKLLPNIILYDERLKNFRNINVLPQSYIKKYGLGLKLHIMYTETKTIKGTMGKDRQLNGDPPTVQGYNLYNKTDWI